MNLKTVRHLTKKLDEESRVATGRLQRAALAEHAIARLAGTSVLEELRPLLDAAEREIRLPLSEMHALLDARHVPAFPDARQPATLDEAIDLLEETRRVLAYVCRDRADLASRIETLAKDLERPSVPGDSETARSPRAVAHRVRKVLGA